MDAETFKRRVTVGILVVGAILALAGVMSGAQWFFGAIEIVREAGDVHSSVR